MRWAELLDQNMPQEVRPKETRHLTSDKSVVTLVVSLVHLFTLSTQLTTHARCSLPPQLHREILSQKKSCSDIINSKDELIKEFQQQLKSKDEEYVKALKQQADDVEEMLQRMRTEFKDLQEEYETELESIERAFLEERDELLENNKNEIDGLFEKRRAMELTYMTMKQEREEQYQREIDDLLVKDAEEYNKLKIKLEVRSREKRSDELRMC